MDRLRRKEYIDQLRLLEWLDLSVDSPAFLSHRAYQWYAARMMDFDYSSD